MLGGHGQLFGPVVPALVRDPHRLRVPLDLPPTHLLVALSRLQVFDYGEGPTPILRVRFAPAQTRLLQLVPQRAETAAA